MNPPKGKIILIGNRKGAIAAAKECGLEPIVIDVKARAEQTHFAYGGSSKWALEQAIEKCQGERPLAAVAVTTGSVMAAAAIREHFQLPGISPEVALKCHDKLAMKHALTGKDIPCARWAETSENTTPLGLIRKLGLPVVLKIPISSGGRGIVICRTENELARHLAPDLLAEGFVVGREMSIETIRSQGRAIFRNHTAYLVPRIANIVPAQLSPKEQREVIELTDRVHQALGMNDGMTHMEVFLTPSGPVFGEIAARPPGGYLMDLIREAYQFDPWDALLRVSLGERPSLPHQESNHAGVWLLHPGEGIVRDVSGKDDAMALPGVTKVSCKLKAGDQIDKRVGSGESVGQIFTRSASFSECENALNHAAATLRISLDP
ncbi:ATP-grasp domain-containing protein [Akkermansiaceae bacterium]|nr:ATP-grasp domain-containing protein [Akkermansiaceae bacterium]